MTEGQDLKTALEQLLQPVRETAAYTARLVKHVGSRIISGAEHGMAIYYDVRKDVLAFVKKTIAPSMRARPVRSR